ncbi:type I phosphodiesterase/nucleotide pyrophosphatase [Candidatus Magnetoovum chiemensis]|nr:type I phosphodiesterase/nucleotide pyrophosphatase [Candidatus Magnetoovum chiemensis]
MMMRMLEHGSIPVTKDNTRQADADNPKGYYEYEQVKKIKENAAWLDEQYGKAFKMVSLLLFDLPSKHKYKVIFMQRNMDEILASQKTMLVRKGVSIEKINNEDLSQKYRDHLNKVYRWLEQNSSIETLFVNYNDIVQNAQAEIDKINRFLGGRLNTEKMAEAVDKSLYRHKR